MSAIAYITDSKMLELHRLNNHKTMNFWRLSNKVNFSDFNEGDLVFFLSKDKEHKNKNEKGIVGFGRLSKINLASIKTMWNKYGVLNGYLSLNEFDEAISKVSKDKKLPAKISSFYLENVTFFQPIYLSECGMKISSNVESYIYLKDEVVFKLLKLAKQSNDLWSNLNDNNEAIEKEEIIFSLFNTHKQIGDINIKDNLYKKSKRELKKYIDEHSSYSFIQNSNTELYKISNNIIYIVLFNDKNIDLRLLLGQAKLYRHFMKIYCESEIELKFSTSDKSEHLKYLLNSDI